MALTMEWTSAIVNYCARLVTAPFTATATTAGEAAPSASVAPATTPIAARPVTALNPADLDPEERDMLNITLPPEEQKWSFVQVRARVEAGGDINATTRHGLTALHSAVKKNDIEMVEWLLKNGANPNVVAPLTPLRLAIRSASDDATDFVSARATYIVALLLKHGAKVDDSFQFYSVLHAAIFSQNTRITRLVLDHMYVNNIAIPEHVRTWAADDNPQRVLQFAQYPGLRAVRLHQAWNIGQQQAE